ncbi:phosphatase PAP2 family protein [Natronorubrum tibetense]|uniref:Phosphoesterase PA-phosphatase-like protein n=1 Tax=Natronorubrum tibetense GA33 TaxID=1114856 RepID=L9VTB7_9EURY|nr:phosphatase PAP2 family protein [Natronorubrum tibetense]ELY40404.1 phosphoesterase PA-phosphatase-like protein [Natronorubrum tibetense GA33]
MRLEDESAVFRDTVSADYADIVVAVTQLGSPTTLMVLLAILFWCGSRRRSALVISYGVAGLGFVLALETLLGLPRPPESVYLTSIDVEGYGFPSGHAFASVVVYGGLVSVYDRLRDPVALLGAGTLVAAVSLSRVVLGVHYLGDVIVGAILGVVFVAAMNRVSRGMPTVGFTVAAALAVPAVYVTNAAAYAVLALGAAIGGLLTAGWIDRLPQLRSRLEGLVLVIVGGSVLVALRIVETVVDLTPLLVALYAALVAWIVFAPALVDRVGGTVFGSPETDS